MGRAMLLWMYLALSGDLLVHRGGGSGRNRSGKLLWGSRCLARSFLTVSPSRAGSGGELALLPTPSACMAPSEAGPSSDLMMCLVMRAGDIFGPGGGERDVVDVRDVVKRFNDGTGGIVERFDDERYVIESFGD